LDRSVYKIEEKLSKSFSEVRFSPPENWHITLLFLGDQEDDALAKIVRVAEEVAAEAPELELNLEKIIFGPEGKEPRMIWAVGDAESSKKIGALKRGLEDRLIEEGVRFEIDHKPATLHITLARIGRFDASSTPRVEEELDLKMRAEKIEVMESELKKDGPEYFTLGSFDLRAPE
jgi:2'-5' RNA ligase